MNESDTIQRTMVMIDALLDTRLGTVLKTQPDVATALFTNPAYYARANDDLNQIDSRIITECYQKAYKERNSETLVESVMTPMVYMLSELAFQFEDQRVNTPYVDEVIVQVNMYPYVIDEEVSEAIAAAIYMYLPLDTKIEIVRIPITELTPSLLKKDYSCLLLYDLAEWFQIHNTALDQTIIPTVTVIAPKLHANGQPAFGKEVFGEGYEHIDPYVAIQRFASPVIGLEFVDVRTCCILRPEEAAQRHAKLSRKLKTAKQKQN